MERDEKRKEKERAKQRHAELAQARAIETMWYEFADEPGPHAIHEAASMGSPTWVVVRMLSHAVWDLGAKSQMGMTALQSAHTLEMRLCIMSRMIARPDRECATLQECIETGGWFDIRRGHGRFPTATAIRWGVHEKTAAQALASLEFVDETVFTAVCEHYAAERIVRAIRALRVRDLSHAIRCGRSTHFIEMCRLVMAEDARTSRRTTRRSVRLETPSTFVAI
jgi:hypothetical protein